MFSSLKDSAWYTTPRARFGQSISPKGLNFGPQGYRSEDHRCFMTRQGSGFFHPAVKWTHF